MSSRYGIRRSDGQWYAGTADRKAIFTAGHAATYDSQVRAAKRMKGLGKEKGNFTYEVAPAPNV
jgi:hypothetical protein